MAEVPSDINPLVRANLEEPLTISVGEALAQEWGQVLGELATWGEVLNDLNGQTYHARQMFTAAQERRSALAKQLHEARLSQLDNVVPFPDRSQPLDSNVVVLADYRQPESPEIA